MLAIAIIILLLLPNWIRLVEKSVADQAGS
jgi:hypothetical protein